MRHAGPMHRGTYAGPGSWPYGGPSDLPDAPLSSLPAAAYAPALRPRRRRRVVLAGVAVVAVCAVIGASTASHGSAKPHPLAGTSASPSAMPSATASASSTADPARDSALAALMARRAAAVNAGDLTAWLADVDPQQPALLAKQKLLFANLRQLPFATFQLVPSTAAAPTFYDVPDSVSSTFADAQATYSAPYVLRYQLSGFDKAAVEDDFAPVFLRRNGSWLLAGDQTATVTTDQRGEPWDGAAIKVGRGRYTLVVVSAVDAKNLPKLVGQADTAITKVASMWPGGWSHRAVMYDVRGSTLFETYLGSSVKTTDFDGVTLGLGEDQGVGITQQAIRVVVNPAYDAPGSKYIPALLTHEFTHVAKWTDRAAGTPRWAIEGIAEYTAYRGHPQDGRVSSKIGSDGRKHRLPKTLPASQSFYSDTTVDYDYGIAWLTFEYLKEKYGENKVRLLYERLAKITDDPDTVDALAAERAAFQAVVHVSEASFVSGLDKWIGQVIRPAH
jgi:hypothetical protein